MTSRCAVALAALLTGCTNGTTVGPASPSSGATDLFSPWASADPSAGSAEATSGTTGAQVVIAFYTEPGCVDGTEVGRRRYDTGQACFSWFAAGSNAQSNSADHFQCYRDRLCYTQHPGSMTCDGGFGTGKEARVGQCAKEPAGRLYARIISGTEDCPPAPEGFECPNTAPGGASR
jgi:hypothetical protein